MWSAATGAKSVYRFTSPTAYTAPSKDATYRIRIKGLPGGVPDAKISSYPNPVKEIGDLLAYFKTNALIYELANVKGGDNAATYPKSAEATVVIDEDDFDKFEARMQTAIENFNEDYLENYPEVTYTYEEVPLPDRVMTEESLNQTVSLLYTLIDGVYFRDEEENLISLSEHRFSQNCRHRSCNSRVGRQFNGTEPYGNRQAVSDYLRSCGYLL